MLNADMLCRELTVASKPSRKNAQRIKELMVTLGQALSTDPSDKVSKASLDALKKTSFFQVQTPKRKEFTSITAPFYINDHERYGNAFNGKVNMLDFTFAELTSLHPLFVLLDSESRYLSKHVHTVTTVNSSMRSDELTSDLRQRAYALSCCANFYRSPKYFNNNTEIHHLFLHAEVLVCDEIWTDLIVKTDNGEAKVRSDRALVKIEQSEQSLVINVPGDETGLYSCYRNELPSELARILGIETDRAVKPVYRILKDEETELDDIMKDEDIPSYSWFEKPPPLMVFRDPEPTKMQDTGVDGDEIPGSNEEIVITTRLERCSQESSQNLPAPAMTFFEQVPDNSTALQRVTQQRAYRRLLDSVIRQARSLPESASEGSFSLAQIGEALDDIRPNSSLLQYLGRGYGGQGRFEDNAKVGAAGELFVFERLRALGFPEFGLENWQSGIREFANVHPEYIHLTNWQGYEVADFMYKDNTGRFENWLHHTCPQFFPPLPGNKTIDYLIEVKTTTGPCCTPFFVSGNQYRLMKRYSLGDGSEKKTTVYLIFRVYNLLSSNMAMEVYVDPWRLRDDVLEFVADPWKVVPLEP